MNLDMATLKCSDQDKISCSGNLFQSMVINKYTSTKYSDIISGPNRAINFADCLYHQDTSQNVFQALLTCSRDNLEQEEYETIISYMKNPLDSGEHDLKDVMQSMKDKTDAIKNKNGGKLPIIPFIQVAGQDSIDAANDIISVACKNYQVSFNFCIFF